MLVPTSLQDLYARRLQASLSGGAAQTCRVCEAYQRSDALVRVLGESVPFLQIKLGSANLVSFLGVETQVSAAAMLKALVHLQERSSRPSLQQVYRLYTLIAQTDESDTQLIRQYFASKPLLLVDAISGGVQPTSANSMSIADLKIELRGYGIEWERGSEKRDLQAKLRWGARACPHPRPRTRCTNPAAHVPFPALSMCRLEATCAAQERSGRATAAIC